MEAIVNKLQEVLEIASEKFRDNDKLKQLEKASEEFKMLVQNGFAKERGYNLESIDSPNIRATSFNTSAK